MSRTLELPEAIYDQLLEAARAGGLSPADWIAAKLPEPKVEIIDEEAIRAARSRLWSHVVSLGHATGLDNEQIDVDLCRSYLDTHDESPDGSNDDAP
jgi:hypothetical protein